MSILLTGKTGFIGSRIFRQLKLNCTTDVFYIVRKPVESSSEDKNQFVITDLSDSQLLAKALLGQKVVIHTAARAHVMKDDTLDPLAEYRRVNVKGTLHLAKQAADSGVRRFIFVSSIGVNGNINTKPFTESDEPNPTEPYAQSKWEAEQGLWEIQRKTGMEIVIIRPPLVYGPNAPGNFANLLRWVEKGIPLPLGAIHNKRSLVALDNLVDLIITCIDHPAAANQVFLAGDGQDVSTTDLLQGVAREMGRKSFLVPVPASVLMLGAIVLGKKTMAKRLLGSLQVDTTKARVLLGWKPPISIEEGLKRCFVDHPRLSNDIE